ncbi:rifin PIR protein, putative [Plasmodium reichenowi]|uniref:Rifin PIR protein, putative n=1 Tax=Plasmodium reichenowi TaxID=5854 RepID=A0A2P9DTB1_PLARE|nr:rifin PIR protein, putative [Plasmodium reichenowi]
MKVHYINILLFALPLNILVYNHRNHKSITPCHTQTNRSLCECELYEPDNYDNDPEMKRVMQQFQDRTSQRFHEYDDRMKTTRQKCKDRCDKEIQKIILKDKLEKKMAQKFATLQTDIQNDAIPPCVCEKSIADKVEKVCLRCGNVFGGGVAPSVGLLGGIGEAAMSAWKVAALKYAIVAAREAGAAQGSIAGNAHGMEIVSFFLKGLKIDQLFPRIYNPFVTTKPFTEVTNLYSSILGEYRATCTGSEISCTLPIDHVPKVLEEALRKATQSAADLTKTTSQSVTAAIKAEKTGEIAATYGAWKTTIIASIVAIVVIVLIMVIIYLILRYRRKKKMKKKLQYIKLLEE